MSLKIGVKVSLFGTALEAVGIVFDILHHLNIGIGTPEGLFTFNHFLIFFGFAINAIGVLIILSQNKNS